MRYYFPSMPNRLDIKSPYFTEIDQDEKWVGEVKKNGWRCLVYRDEGGLTLWTRRHTVINYKLPLLRQALLEMIPERTVIDGELLDRRTKITKQVFYAFDILVHRNVPLLKLAWHERRTVLEHIVRPIDGLVELSAPISTDKRKLYYDNIGSELVEGVVLKHSDSPYLVGLKDCVDNPFWLKVKRPELCQYQ